MDWERYEKYVISHKLSALSASFIVLIVTQLWKVSGEGGGAAVTWRTQ
ncbi:hypothetical protein [Bacillus sp. ISL-37]|nr:hypothetical protein [Bacillus sp. ISL-37]MBT2684157.1 hypothetical protein [Bacillus sp. ISL-37]